MLKEVSVEDRALEEDGNDEGEKGKYKSGAVYESSKGLTRGGGGSPKVRTK